MRDTLDPGAEEAARLERQREIMAHVGELREIIKEKGARDLVANALASRDLEEMKAVLAAASTSMLGRPGSSQYEQGRVVEKEWNDFFDRIDSGTRGTLNTWIEGIQEVYFITHSDGTLRVRPHSQAGDQKRFKEVFKLEGGGSDGPILMQLEDLKRTEN